MNLANKISIARIILIPFFIASIVYSRMEIALILFSLAVISDGVDGFIARALRQKTELGKMLDPIADKLLLVSAYICLAMAGNIPAHLKMPPYVPIMVISRDAIIVLGSIIVHIITGDLKVSPSMLGKVTTFFQMITIVAILMRFSHPAVLWNTTVFLTAVSGMDYVIKGSRLLSNNHTVPKKTG